MASIAQEHLLPQVVQATEHVLKTAAEQLARPSGLIQRQGKLTGAAFAQTVVLGWLDDPHATLEVLTQHAQAAGVEITAQGLDERFTPRAVAFLQALFEVALGQVVIADPVAVPLLARFGAVCLEDSTTISLPRELASVFAGCGGKGSSAACKLFVRLDMLCGQLECSPLLPGKHADTRSPLRAIPTPKRTLHIRDRGFTDVPQWRKEAQEGQLVLSYARADLNLFAPDGSALDLLDLLSQAGPAGERAVLVGRTRFPMRLLFEQVPEEVAKERRRRLRREAKTRGQVLSQRVNRLAGWTIVVTTVPRELLSLEEALVLLRLRWQIELLFKLWKQEGLLDEWRTKKAERILCEVYAKLIGLLLQHWILIVSCWQEPLRSLVKAAKAVRRHVALLSAALQGELSLLVALRRTQQAVQAGSRQNVRRQAPNTAQMVLSGQNQWSNQPLRKRRRK